jgi:hypothetical protein
MTPEVADRIATVMSPLVEIYLNARAEANRTQQVVVRAVPGGRMAVPPDSPELAG